MRRGGRIGSAAALLGSALAVKPILQVSGGRVEPREKVRTQGRALARLEELAVLGAAAYDVEVTVCHLANEPAAAGLAERLQARPTYRVRLFGSGDAVVWTHPDTDLLTSSRPQPGQSRSG